MECGSCSCKDLLHGRHNEPILDMAALHMCTYVQLCTKSHPITHQQHKDVVKWNIMFSCTYFALTWLSKHVIILPE